MKKIIKIVSIITAAISLTASICLADFTNANLNCRTLPSMKGNIITTFPKGTEVSVLGVSGNWLQVQKDDIIGYCYNKYIQSEPVEAENNNQPQQEAQQESENTENRVYAGKFKLTGYCPCKKCCGGWGRRTASGAVPQEGVTVAASKQFPFGTKLYIEGVGYRTVQDRGGAIKGNKLDVFVSSHSACYSANINRTADVYIIK